MQPSLDVWLLLILLAIAACCGKRLLLWTTLILWVFFLVLRLFASAIPVVPMYLNRPFNLYIDSGYLFGLYDLLKTSSRHRDFLLMSASDGGCAGVHCFELVRLAFSGKKFLVKPVRGLFLVLSGLLFSTGLIRGWQR